MAKQREVILLGLGKFGTHVNNYLMNLIDERKYQLGTHINSVNLHYLSFDSNDVFHSADIINAITSEVKDSPGYKRGENFSYFIFGDLYEAITSKYAIDYAYIPHLLNSNAGRVIPLENVVGFFTFSDQIGIAEKVSDESMGLIYQFFKRLEKINETNIYEVPYKDVDNKSYGVIKTPNGPFERNYMLITPGDSSSVAKETGNVFAERIFYELFYLADTYEKIQVQHQAEIVSEQNYEKNFSSFSMVEIPRIYEIQKHYLKYSLENKILDSFIDDEIKGTDIPEFEKDFFKIIDVPYGINKEFPIKRAVQLFIEDNKAEFDKVLIKFISRKDHDLKEYIQECKERIIAKTEKLNSRYDQFVIEEFSYMFKTLEKGFLDLFKINRLTGNINSYISFIQKLKSSFENWDAYLNNCANSAIEVDLDEAYKTAEKKIKKYQKSKIYSLFFLRPIREKLIENQILSLPVEEYLEAVIQKKLAAALLLQWREAAKTDINPIKMCSNLIEDLEYMKEKISFKNEFVRNQLSFIESINSYYYVIQMYDTEEDYKKILERIKDKNFGMKRKAEIDATVTNAFKQWTSDKDFVNMVQDPKGFISFLENDYIPNNMSIYSEIEKDADHFVEYAQNAISNAKERTHNLNLKSFNIDNYGSFITEKDIMLEPILSNTDILKEVADNEFKSTSVTPVQIPNEFTLGSIIMFKDYLYMSLKDLQKNVVLEKYKTTPLPEFEYDNELTFIETKTQSENQNNSTATDSDSDDNSEKMRNYSKKIIKFYMSEEQRLALYKELFNTNEIDDVTDDMVIEMAKLISFENLLPLLEEDKLDLYAKDNKIPLKTDRKKQEEIIIYTMKKKASKK